MTTRTSASRSSEATSYAVGPLSFEDGRRLLAVDSNFLGPSGPVLRSRSLLAIQSYEAAWVALKAALLDLPPGLLRTRAEVDMMSLCYYLAARDRVEELFQDARAGAQGHPLLLAEAYVALSLCATATNDMRRAVDALGFAEDNLRSLPPSRERSLVAGKVYRQRAHVLGQIADYVRAIEAAEHALEEAAKIHEEVESSRAEYTIGFVSLLAGRVARAISHLEIAERLGRRQVSPSWRWTALCLARAYAEAGRPFAAARLASESGFDAPEEYAFLAVCRGDAPAAHRILAAARPPMSDEIPFRQVVDGIARAELGQWVDSIRLLEDAADIFARAMLRHYELGARVHASYARDQLRRGAGRTAVLHLLHALTDAGANGFAWFRPAVALWAAERSTDRTTRVVADSLRRRAADWAAAAEGEHAERAHTWRAQGLTWREVQIVQAIIRQHVAGMPMRERKQLAVDLGISIGTLKTHLTSIRQKVGVTERGDNELLALLESRDLA